VSATPDPAGYRGERIALLTQHGKERVIAPRVGEWLGAEVAHVTGYDTDRLGTFTREIPRAGTQLEAARRKARIAMELSGLRIAIASEGAFGPDPVSGLLPWNRELVLLVDDRLGLEVLGMAEAPAQHVHAVAERREDLDAFARRAGFPGHWLVLQPLDPDDPPDAGFRKGLHDWPALEAAFAAAQRASSVGRVHLENDLRAHGNPTRMAVIASATDDLLRRTATRCPDCGRPGYGVTERIPGLPCADCGTPTRRVRAERVGCGGCGREELRELDLARLASPAHCDVCNP
jgi:ribosomal protein L37E